MHWYLSVQFVDVYARASTGQAAHNAALVRHIVLHLIRMNTSRKGSTNTKPRLAAMSDEYRAEMVRFGAKGEEDDDD